MKADRPITGATRIASIECAALCDYLIENPIM